MSDATTFIHLSDLHIGDAADSAILSDTGATLEAVMDIVGAIAPPPRFVVVSGDLTQRGDAASYRIVRAALDRLPCPVVTALGNHDDRSGHAQVWAGTGADAAFASTVIDGIHLLVLDTSVPGRIGGAIDGPQFDRIAAALDAHPGLPTVVVMHHPPALGGEMGWRALDRVDTLRLGDLLRRHDVKAVLSGHIHQDRVAVWNGIPVVTVSGQHATMDALHTDGLRNVSGASFGLCRLGPQGFTVTFIQLPSDRRELERLSRETVLSFV